MVDALTDLFITRGPPEFIRSDNGGVYRQEGTRQDWSRRRPDGLHRARLTLGKRLLRELQCPVRDELLNAEVFYSLREAQILIEEWRRHHNTVRPHSSLGYRPPAPEVIVLIDQRPPMH